MIEKQDKLNRTIEKEIMEELRPLYLDAYKIIIGESSQLLDMIEQDARPLEIYKYNRLQKLERSIRSELTKLGSNEVKIFDNKLKEMWEREQDLITVELKTLPAPINYEQAEAIIKGVWCSDGKRWSDRIWSDKGQLAQELSEVLVSSVLLGTARAKISKVMAERFNVSYYNANRLCRTELTYVQNQAALNRYRNLGVKQYKITAELDKRVCELCKSLDGNIYNVDNALVGVNIPVFHPNCRCGIIIML